MKHPLYIVTDKDSEHFGKYIKKIYISGDGRWACQVYDNSEKMFLEDSQLMPKQEWEAGNYAE